MLAMEKDLLEDWLQRAAISSPKSPPPPPSAQAITQAWSQVRDCTENGILQPQHSAAFTFLREYGPVVHVAEPQARLLVSFLTSVSSPDDTERWNNLDRARGSAAFLLSIWLRRSVSRLGPKAAACVRIQEILQSLVDNTLKALDSENSSPDNSFASEAILLLGTVCVTPQVRKEQQATCQEEIVRECTKQRAVIFKRDFNVALAGVGYALVSSNGHSQRALMQVLLSLWAYDMGLDKSGGKFKSNLYVENGLFLLHLMEWYASQQQQATSMHVAVEEIMHVSSTHKAPMVKCAVVMSAAGLLRSFHLRRRAAERKNLESLDSVWHGSVELLYSVINRLVDATVHLQAQNISAQIEAGSPADAKELAVIAQTNSKSWLHSVAIGMSRCMSFPSSPPVLISLLSIFFEDVLQLGTFGNGARFPESEQSEQVLAEHVKSILFSEAGAIFRAISDQYQSANKGWQLWIEDVFSQYSNALYRNCHSYFAEKKSQKEDGLRSLLPNGPLRKVLEAALFSVVMLFSYASKQKMNNDVSVKGQLAARVLICLACLEFIRQGQIPEYGELVQRCVNWVCIHESTSGMLVSMFPSFEDISHPAGPSSPGYSWKEDYVQDSRVLFGFRVLPSCLRSFPASSFLNAVAPTMFLYMKHPNPLLVQASHSLLVSFLSTKTGESDSYRDSIKEQLAFRFIERTFEEFPFIVNYDVFVTAVGAMARHLPAGSTAMVHCVASLSRRASDLFRSAADKGWKDQLELGKKLQTLLLHLILIVDVQVLAQLLQEAARLVLGQKDPHRTYALEEAFDILAGSDDLTRKHILVPWLQSLSYICTNSDGRVRSPSTRIARNRKRERRNRLGIGEGEGAVAFNPSSAVMEAGSLADHDICESSRSRL